MRYAFPAASAAILAAHGWQAGRNIAPQAAILAWEQDGYTVFPAGVHFIQSFHGIALSHRSWNGDADDESCFDAIQATGALIASGRWRSTSP